jgi:hypothetical protein
VVELTIALHHVFNTPEDRLIWDVGHRAYPPTKSLQAAVMPCETSGRQGGAFRLYQTQ